MRKRPAAKNETESNPINGLGAAPLRKVAKLLLRSGSDRSGVETDGRTGRMRLSVEPLEARRLLAGLNVSVLVDQNNTQRFVPSADEVAPDRIVFVDSDRDGQYSDGDLVALTGPDGVARFGDLPSGDYWVGLHNPSGQQQLTGSQVQGVASLGFQLCGRTLADQCGTIACLGHFLRRSSPATQ